MHAWYWIWKLLKAAPALPSRFSSSETEPICIHWLACSMWPFDGLLSVALAAHKHVQLWIFVPCCWREPFRCRFVLSFICFSLFSWLIYRYRFEKDHKMTYFRPIWQNYNDLEKSNWSRDGQRCSLIAVEEYSTDLDPDYPHHLFHRILKREGNCLLSMSISTSMNKTCWQSSQSPLNTDFLLLLCSVRIN